MAILRQVYREKLVIAESTIRDFRGPIGYPKPMERDKHNGIVFYSLRPRVDGTVVHWCQFLFRMKRVKKKNADRCRSMPDCLKSPRWSKEVGAWNTTQARNETEDARARNTIHGKGTRSTKVVVIDVPNETALWKALPESKSIRGTAFRLPWKNSHRCARAGSFLLVLLLFRLRMKRSVFRLKV